MLGTPVTSATWTVHTDVFEGPLDLLLYLVKRDGIDLKTLHVAQVADSYVAYLDRMRDLNLSVASEYLVMAATLVHLKSLELLPRPPTPVEEDEEDPRAALVRRLEEYSRYKDVADELADHHRVGRDTFVREPMPMGDHPRPLVPGIDVFGLLDVYYDLLQRAEPEPEPTFVAPGSSGPDLESCCRWMLRALVRNGGGELTSLLRLLRTKAERVMTFIGVLEMARLRWIELTQEDHLAPVKLVAVVDESVDFGAITGWVGDGEPEEASA